MRKITKIICTFLLLFISNFAISQSFENFEMFIVNEWILEKYEIDGQVLPPKEGHEDDRMIFTKDFISKSISYGVVQNGTWNFDNNAGIFTVVDDKKDFNMIFRVISCSEKQCVFEMENPKNQKIFIYLKVDEK